MKQVYKYQCEGQGFYTSGVRGVLAHVEDGQFYGAERCDACELFQTDEAAEQALIAAGIEKAPLKPFHVYHTRQVSRYATFMAANEQDAPDQARAIDENEGDWEGWDTVDDDPGEYNVYDQ